jgi:hypothetical protein
MVKAFGCRPVVTFQILILRDEADDVVLPFEPYMLLSAAHRRNRW